MQQDADDEVTGPMGDGSPSHQVSEEEVDYNVMGSFPASDPPSWTLGVRPHKTYHTEFGGDVPGPDNPTYQNEPPE